jgi:hypothetical protein
MPLKQTEEKTMKFIYLYAAILVLSFTALPVFYGVSNERTEILASNEINDAAPADQALSFEEIYEIAAQGQEALGQEGAFDPSSLNAIAPAAGNGAESFPSGFSGMSDAALTDAPISVEATPVISE